MMLFIYKFKMLSADVSFDHVDSSAAIKTSSIGDFYRNMNVLVTGGTGFLGKVLIEKLLRSCEDIGAIYVIIRPKKGQTPEERLQKLLALPVFERVHREKPAAFNKVVAIEADLSEASFSLNERDRKLIEEVVSVVFHSAATVKFDEELQSAVNTNVRGTKNMLDLAKCMKSLKAFVYMSTAYSNSDRRLIEEKYYPPKAPEKFWQDLILAAEKMEGKELNALTPRLIGDLPNTYTFTKQIAESLVYEHKDVVPIVIFRPSIVMFALKEPHPGWVDNLNGLTGMMLGYCTGAMRVCHGRWSAHQDYVPVDYVVNATIASAWRRAQLTKGECPVYNCTSGKYTACFKELYLKFQVYSPKNPTRIMLWKPNMSVVENFTFYRLLFFLFHLLPALFIEVGLKAFRIDFSLLKVYRKIFTVSKALSFFILNTFYFQHENYLGMLNKMTPEDRNTYYFDISDIVGRQGKIGAVGIIGLKKYILNEDTSESSTEKLRQRYKFYELADVVVKSLFVAFIITYLWKYLSQFVNCF